MKNWLLMLVVLPGLAFANWTSSDKKTPEETLEILDYQDELMNAYLWLPEDHDPNLEYSAVVMVHGCGGAHYKDIPEQWTAKYISGKYKVWGKLLNQQNIMVLMVDSFTHRDVNNDIGGGVCGGDPLDRPAKIDPISVRPADIAKGIEYLKSRDDVDADKVGVLSFSNGGTAALALANHAALVQKQQALMDAGKEWFNLPFDAAYQASTFVSLYPGCGLNGYTDATQGVLSNDFNTYAETFLFSASNDTSLPDDTLEKCAALRTMDAQHAPEQTNMQMRVVENTNHQFDYKEEDEQPVIRTIDRILSLFATM